MCGSCHDSTPAKAHIATQSFMNFEACQTCHGLDDEYAVDRVHFVR